MDTVAFYSTKDNYKLIYILLKNNLLRFNPHNIKTYVNFTSQNKISLSFCKKIFSFYIYFKSKKNLNLKISDFIVQFVI